MTRFFGQIRKSEMIDRLWQAVPVESCNEIPYGNCCGAVNIHTQSEGAQQGGYPAHSMLRLISTEHLGNDGEIHQSGSGG